MGYYMEGALVRRVWSTGFYCYKRGRGYYRVGALVRRVWLTRVYFDKRDMGYYRVGALVKRVWLTRVYCYKRDGLLQSRGISKKGIAIRDTGVTTE